MPAKFNDGTSLRDLNFKVDPELRRAFKTAACAKSISMKQLLEESFHCWLEAQCDDTLRVVLPKI